MFHQCLLVADMDLHYFHFSSSLTEMCLSQRIFIELIFPKQKSAEIENGCSDYLHYGVNEKCNNSKGVHWHEQTHAATLLIRLMH